MNTPQYLYGVIDAKTGVSITEKLNPSELHDFTGIDKGKISMYLSKGFAYKKKYIITSVDIEQKEASEAPINFKQDYDLYVAMIKKHLSTEQLKKMQIVPERK
jgi:hypothetical protein